MTQIDTSTEAVERLAKHIKSTCGCALGSDAEQPVAETLRSLLKERDDLRDKLDAAVSIADSALNAVIEVQDYKQPDDPWAENALTRQELDIFDFDVSTARAALAKIKGHGHE